jgi:WD40 repeat protein
MTGKEVRRWKAHESPIHTVAFAPDGKMLASSCLPDNEGHFEQSVKLWEADTGKELRRFDLRNPFPYGEIAFSPDSKTLFASDGPGTRAWNTTTGKELTEFTSRFEKIRLLALAPDGRSMLIAADRPGGGPGSPVNPKEAIVPPFALFDIRTGTERLRFEGIPAQQHITSFAFSPNGRVLAAGGGSSSKIHLWDTLTGKRLGLLDGHKSWILALAFAPDGKSLASASYDTTVLIWSMAGILPERNL